MKKSLNDLAVDIIKERINTTRSLLKEQFKGTKPFRKEPADPIEQLYDYKKFRESGMEQEMRQSVGDSPVDAYMDKMEKIARRYRHG